MAEFNRKRREDLRKWWESGHKEFSAKEQSQKNPERSVTILDIPFYTEKNFEDWLAEVEREKAEKKNKLVEAEPTKTE